MTENELSRCGNVASSSNDDGSQIFPGYKNVPEFTQSGLRLLMENIRASNDLPSGQKWDYYTSFPSYKKVMDAEGRRILNLMNMIFRHQGVQGNILRRDIEEKFELLVDANDQIFERVGNTLDEILGIKKNPEPVLVEAAGTSRAVSGSWNKSISSKVDRSVPTQFQPQSVRLLTAKNIERPQAKFRDKIDNSNTQWEPRIKEKPNSLKPLAILIEENEDGECFSHPYEFELDRFEPAEDQLNLSDPVKPKSIEEVPLIMVEKPDQISPLLEDLLKYKKIAIDLEHHSYRTFQGFTCLMQISTGDTDYLIDTLSLRANLYVLNEVFTNKKILKIFHGAEQDILWLQRDLSLYIVNMFDTYQAAKVLNFAGLSLSFLLKHYCNVNAEKHFQLADWRIRPLPEELKQYARADTHYLIYIYERMRNELLETANGQTNLLQSVYQRSTEVCKRRYAKLILRDDSHMELYRKSKKMFHNRQMYALKHLFQWRDKVAREEDESLGYVLPNHMLLHMCELLPREIQGILSCCNPIPPLVRQHLVEMHQIILKAREQPLVKPVVEEELRRRPVAETWTKLNLESPLHCPHDVAFQLDFRDDLPTLLKPLKNGDLEKVSSKDLWMRASLPLLPTLANSTNKALEKDRPEIDLGSPTVPDNNSPSTGIEKKPDLKDLIAKVNFLSPFECYKRVRPYLDHLGQEKLREHQEREESLLQEKVQETSKELTNEERIARMQQDIQRMSAVKETSGTSSTSDAAASITFKSTPLSVQSKGVKRKSSPLKGQLEDGMQHQSKVMKHSKSPNDCDERKQAAKNFMMPSRRNPSDQSRFEPFDYQQANYSRFQSGNQSRNRDVQSHFKSKKQRGKNFKSASRATQGLEGNRGGKISKGRGRGRF